MAPVDKPCVAAESEEKSETFTYPAMMTQNAVADRGEKR
jgi:hypothetical protein